MSMPSKYLPFFTLAAGVVCGGLGGAVFTWAMNRPQASTITYSVTTTTAGTDSTVKSLIPNLSLRIGGDEISAIHTHVIEVTAPRDQYVPTLDVGILFDSAVKIYGMSSEAPTPLHRINCAQVRNGCTCSLQPVSPGQAPYRVLLATNLQAPPRVITTTRNIQLLRLDQFIAGGTWPLSGGLLGALSLSASALAVAVAFLSVVVGLVTYRRASVSRSNALAIRAALTLLAERFGHPETHVRANVMLVTKDSSRRRVDSVTAFNMDADPDRDLEIEFGAGVSGAAAVNRRGVIADLRQRNPPLWGLAPTEEARLRKTLKSVLSVPIFDSKRGGEVLLGTLQVESDQDIEHLGWNEATVNEVQRFADAIALLLTSD